MGVPNWFLVIGFKISSSTPGHTKNPQCSQKQSSHNLILVETKCAPLPQHSNLFKFMHLPHAAMDGSLMLHLCSKLEIHLSLCSNHLQLIFLTSIIANSNSYIPCVRTRLPSTLQCPDPLPASSSLSLRFLESSSSVKGKIKLLTPSTTTTTLK